MIAAYQWSTVSNWGDKLTVPLLKKFALIEARAVPDPDDADVVSVGSVVHHLRPDWAGTVLGAGTLWEGTTMPVGARVLGVRGQYTYSLLTDAQKDSCISIGDPGLIADELVPVPGRIHKLGVLPHWSDAGLWERREFWRYSPLMIDPRSDPLAVIRQIGSCEKLVTSSLHGLVLADAFGIPVRFEMGGRLTREGATHKHEEYSESIGVEFEIGRTREANRFKVNDVRQQIIDMFEAYGGLS